jgi:hypothetical protein
MTTHTADSAGGNLNGGTSHQADAEQIPLLCAIIASAYTTKNCRTDREPIGAFSQQNGPE